MATEQRVVELVVDASGAVAGTRIGAEAYDHFGARAEAALARAQAAADRQFTVFQNRLPKSVDAVGAAYDNLRAKMDPVFYAQLRAEREMTQSLAVVNRAVLLGVTTQEQATRDILRLKNMQVEAINRVRDAQLLADRAVIGANDNFPMGNEARFRRQNLSYQYMDVAQTLAAGAPLGMVAMQQGPQILQLYAGQGGFNAALKDTQALLGGVARALGPVAAAAVAAYGAWELLSSYSVDAAFSVSESTKTLAGQAASWQSIEGQVSQLSQVQKSYNDLIVDTARVHSSTTATIIANSEREFAAKKALMEVELLRQRASIEVQRAEIGRAENQLRSDIATSTFNRDDLERMGVYDPRIGQFAPIPQKMDQVDPIDRLNELLARNPLTAKIKEMRANLDLTVLSTENLAEALRKVFDPTAGGVIDEDGKLNEFVPFNPAIPGRNPRRSLLDDPAFSSTANRLRDLRMEVELFGLAGGAAAKLRFEREALNAAAEKGIEISAEQRASLRRDAEEYGRLTDQLSRLRLQKDVQFEIGQMMRSDREARVASQLQSYGLPIDLAGQDAALLRTNEILKDMRDTWQEVGDVGRSAIDKLTDGMAEGFEDFDGILKSIVGDINREFLRLAVANPLKNAIFGDTHTTLGDIGGARGFFSALTGGKMPLDPALRTVSTMQVTAATVMVNGGVSGLGAADGVTRMFAPANRNIAGSVPNTDVAAFIRERASLYGIDPDVALAVARSEGGLNSWNLQSNYGKNGVREQSFGPFQLYKGGGLGNVFMRETGLDPAFAANGPAATDWALRYASKNGWGSWYGAAKSGIGDWEGIDRSGKATVAALDNVTTSAIATTRGLGSLGSGLGQFGDFLSTLGSGKGSGGLFSDFLGNLGGFFGGVSPTSPLWAPNTTLSNYLGGIPGFDGGGDTPFGNRSGGLDGKGGFLAMLHPRETVVDHTRSAAAPAIRQNVTRQINIVNAPPGYYPDVEEEDDGYGNEKVNVTFSKMAASEARRTGSPLNRQLRGMGARPRRKMM